MPLYDYQERGVQFLLSRKRALLADEMGLGKTAQVITAIAQGGLNQRVIVVCPASVRGVWQREVATWAPDFGRSIYAGKGAFRIPFPGEFAIMSYESLPDFRESKGVDGKPLKWPSVDIPRGAPVTVIADEAHALKSSKSLRRNSFQALTRGVSRVNGRVWLLTATPLLNVPNELWNVLNSAGGMANEAFGSWGQFVEVFGGVQQYIRCKPSFEFPKGIRPAGYEWGVKDISPALPYLERVMLRRTRDQVALQLPAKSRVIVPIEVDTDIQTMIDEVVAESGAEWTEAFIESLLDKPLQFKTIAKLRAKLAEAKTKALIEIVEEYVDAGEPLVVFSAHLAPLKAMAKKYKCPLIIGDTPPATRTGIVEDFQAGRVKLLGATIKAGGVGITLTASRHSIFLDSEWSPLVNLQAEDRIYRIGQSRNVLIKYLVANNVIDERVTSVLMRKQRMIEKAGL